MRYYGRNEYAEDVTRCAYSIYLEFDSSQCTRPRGHGPDGLFCKQHAKTPFAPDDRGIKRYADMGSYRLAWFEKDGVVTGMHLTDDQKSQCIKYAKSKIAEMQQFLKAVDAAMEG